MTQDKDIPTINLTVPTGWDKLADNQLRYVFGTIAQGTPAPPLVLPQVLRLSHATEGVLRGERWQDVLRDIIIGFVERFQTKSLIKDLRPHGLSVT